MTLPSDIIERATEVVKNLQNIFDKLFEILTSKENELKTREQEQFGVTIDLNRIHQTAFHALVRFFFDRKRFSIVDFHLDFNSRLNFNETIRIVSNSSR